MIDILESCERKARKDHECWLCGRTIPKGTVYYYYKQIDNGDFGAFKTHLLCQKIAEDNDWFEGDGSGDGVTEDHMAFRQEFGELIGGNDATK